MPRPDVSLNDKDKQSLHAMTMYGHEQLEPPLIRYRSQHGLVKGTGLYLMKSASDSWKAYRTRKAASHEAPATQEPQGPRDPLLARSLKRNVRKRLAEGKNSRYLAAKAGVLYWLSPTPETAEMDAEAYMRVYDRKKSYDKLEGHLQEVFAAGEKRKDILDAHVRILRREVGRRIWDTAPTKYIAELAHVRSLFDTEEKVGALHDRAVALARVYEATPAGHDAEELIAAYNLIEQAYALPDGKTDWVERTRGWIFNLVREEVRRLNKSDKPSRDAVKLAEFRAKHETGDTYEYAGALHDTAIAYGRFFEKADPNSRDVQDLIEANRYARAASDVSNGEIDWVEGVRAWTLNLLRGEVVRRNQDGYRGSERSTALAEERLELDYSEKVGALHDLAIAYAKLYLDTPAGLRRRNDLELAHTYISDASTLSGGQLDWVEGRKQWIESLESSD